MKGPNEWSDNEIKLSQKEKKANKSQRWFSFHRLAKVAGHSH